MPLPKAPSKPAAILAMNPNAKPLIASATSATAAPVSPTAQIAPRGAAVRPASQAALTQPSARVAPPASPASSASKMSNVQARLPAEKSGKKPTRKSNVSVTGARKLFVLDTNVLMHDPSSLFRFAEHDVFLPMMTLEELDNNKKGMSEVARNARQVSRALDGLVAGDQTLIDHGISLSKLGNADALGKIFFQTGPLGNDVAMSLPMGKADNQILAVVMALRDKVLAQADDYHHAHEVVLVTKDINMRIKARALGLPAEDYFNDQVIEDSDLLYSGSMALPEDFWDKHSKGMESWQQQGSTFYRLSGPMSQSFLVNQFVHLAGELPLNAQVREINGRTVVLQTLKDYTHLKNAVWSVAARNPEQNFALNLLMNTDIDFVTLLGQAGTGKTLLALAAGLVQTMDNKRFSEIIMTRATVPVGDDIGYLPGTEEEKMLPWMGALEDNLEVLLNGDGSGDSASAGGDWGRASTADLVKSKIRVKSMSFMRGRTFTNKFLIIDEAQNLTPKQMKTLITRAGPGTKVVCLGNIAQIDTPYLTEGSSGLTYVVDRFKGWAHAGHILLQRGERSRLADYASEAL